MQTPIALGIIFDIGDHFVLQELKRVIIAIIKKFESATEDKVYLYKADQCKLNRWIGESVAEIASFNDLSPINPEYALTQTIYAMMVLEQSKHIFYISDRFQSSGTRRIKRALKIESDCIFTLIAVGKELPALEEAAESCYRWIDEIEMIGEIWDDRAKIEVDNGASERVLDVGERDNVSEISFNDQ